MCLAEMSSLGNLIGYVRGYVPTHIICIIFLELYQYHLYYVAYENEERL